MEIVGTQNSSGEASLLERRIGEATAMIEDIQARYAHVEGANKLCNKVKTELKFLTSVSPCLGFQDCF